MRYAYAITTALLVGGAAITMGTNAPLGAQTAQNDSRAVATAVPRAGAPASFADLTARLQPAVVNISTRQTVQVQSANPFAGTPFADFFGQFGGQQGGGRPVTRQAQSLGSGFIISSDGYIVTNNHVISPGQRNAVVDSITVTLPDRKEYEAKLIGRDPASDLALLKINAKSLPFVTFGDSTQARVGDWVVAIGNPFGLGGTVTAGIVSALHRNTGSGPYDRYIQTDASINFGNSGGPMFDMAGNVIGINSAIFSPTGGNVGIGFAIPAEQAKPIIETLKGGGQVQRGYLGIQIQPIDETIAASLGLPKNTGELIARVEPGEGAAKAGIQQGDVVTKVNGVPVTPDNTLSYLIANIKPGTRVPIELMRKEKTMTVTATVGQRPPEDQLAAFATGEDDQDVPDTQSSEQANQASLGVSVQTLTPQIARQLGVDPTVKGVVVAAVDPSSEAAQSNIRRGDVIISANQRPTPTPQDLAAAVRASQSSNRPVLLLVQRGNRPAVYIGVRVRQK